MAQGLQRIHDKLRAELAAEGAWVDGILVACDAAGEGASRRRKPGPGMLEEAMTHFGVSCRRLAARPAFCPAMQSK